MAYQYLNNAGGLVAPDFTRAVGGGVIRLRPGDGLRFGTPSPESPIKLSVHRKNPAPTSDLDAFLSIVVLHCEGRTDDDLNVTAAVEGFADAEVLAGDLVTCEILAGDLAALWAALAAIELTPGPPGSVLRDGSGPPADALGIDGDYYLERASGDLYLRASGSYSIVANLRGPKGEPGTDGTDGLDGAPGSVLRSGDGPPAAGLGIDGDYYLDRITGNVYFRASGSYSVVANLKGPAGADGQPADESNLVHRDGAETISGTKTFTGGAIVRGGLSVRNSVGAEVAGFDGDGFGFPAPIAFTLARGVDLAAGTDLTDGGALVPFAGKLAKVLVKAKVNGASGGFSLQLRRNGTAIFAAPVAVAAGDTSTKVFASFAVDSVSPGDEITPDASAVGAGVQGVRVLLVPLGGNR